jgi:hypothetical protein
MDTNPTILQIITQTIVVTSIIYFVRRKNKC